MGVKSFVSKYEPFDANTYVGQFGEFWINYEGTDVHVGDNTTPGGIVLGSGGGGDTGEIAFFDTTISTNIAPANITIMSNGIGPKPFVFESDGSLKLPEGVILGDAADIGGFDIFVNNTERQWNSLTFGKTYDRASFIYLQNNNDTHQALIEIFTGQPGQNAVWTFNNDSSMNIPGNVYVAGEIFDFEKAVLNVVQEIQITATGPGQGSAMGYANISVSNSAPILYTGLVIGDGTSNQKYAAGTPTSGTQQISFNTGESNTEFSVVAFVTTPVGTLYTWPANGTSSAAG